MPLSAEDIALVVRAQSTLLGLPITASQRPGVEAYLALAAGMAEPVLRLAAQLGPPDESGSIFQPLSPAGSPSDLTEPAGGDAAGGRT